MHSKIMINPTTRSNWLIPNVLAVGGFPSQKDLNALTRIGINVFICLCTDKEMNTKKLKIREYKEFVTANNCEWYHFPIVDQCTAPDESVFIWSNIIIDLLYRNKKIYLHCFGGHGRAGTIGACVLQSLGMNAPKAIDLVYNLHASRYKGSAEPSPANNNQLNQIHRFMKLSPSIVVCGDRNWDEYTVIHRELSRLPTNSTIIQGGCRGADLLAKRACDELGMQCITVNADWDTHGKKAGPLRNERMLNEYGKIDLVIAFHANIDTSKGTKDTLNRAVAKNIYTRIIID